MVKFDNQTKVDEAYRKSPREGKATHVIGHRINHNATGEVQSVHENSGYFLGAGERIAGAEGMVSDLTGQKTADEQIRSIAKFLWENPHPVLRADRRGVVLYANESCRQLGTDHLAEVGLMLPPEWLALVEKAFAAGERVEADVPEDGKVWLVTVAPVLDEGYANLYAVDITQQIETEKALVRIREDLESQVRDRTLELEAANSSNRNMIESIVDPMVTITLDGKIGDVNAATESVTGFPRTDLIGQDFASFFTDQEKARAVYRKVFDEEKVSDYELEIRHRDGHLTPVLLNASVFLEGTRRTKAVIATARDITQRRQDEAQVKANARRVEIMDEISRLLADAKPNYQPLLKNFAEQMVRVFGGECLIHSLSMDGRLHIAARYPAAAENAKSCTSDSANFIERLVNWSYQSQKPLFLPTATEEEIRRSGYTEEIPAPEGACLSSLIVIPMLFQSNPLGVLTLAQCASGSQYTAADLALMQTIADRLEQTIANSRLLSDLQNALSEEQEARKQLVLNEKLAAMGRLLGSVAHELNNPLQTIKNCLYLMQQEEPVDTAIQNYIRMASSETQRLVNLVAELRELYRPHPDKMYNPYNVVEILHEVRQLMEPQLFAGNVQWRQSNSPAGFIVRCDKEQIQQVLINLATNAIEAMQPAGGILSVDLTLSPDLHRVGIVFQDTGPGIPADLISTLFEPFATTKPSGLGLGLSICYEIAQKHGGSIIVESPPGKGAAFCFWLPLIVKSY